MRKVVTRKELDTLAEPVGLQVHKECGGYRLVKDVSGVRSDIFPDSGICPVATKRECLLFLKGAYYGVEHWLSKKETSK